MLTNVAVALFLAAAVERIVEHLVAKPMEQKLPEVDRWFLMRPELRSRAERLPRRSYA